MNDLWDIGPIVIGTPDDPFRVDVLHGVRANPDLDDQSKEDLIQGRCMRSGACCNAGPCGVALMRGEQRGRRCSYLRGDAPGEYACQLVLDGDQETIISNGIGMVCGEPTDLDRLLAAYAHTKKRRNDESEES